MTTSTETLETIRQDIAAQVQRVIEALQALRDEMNRRYEAQRAGEQEPGERSA